MKLLKTASLGFSFTGSCKKRVWLSNPFHQKVPNEVQYFRQLCSKYSQNQSKY